MRKDEIVKGDMMFSSNQQAILGPPNKGNFDAKSVMDRGIVKGRVQISTKLLQIQKHAWIFMSSF